MKFKFKKIFSTDFFNVEEGIDLDKPETVPYYRVTGSDSVICCVMNMNGDFVMVKQYRPSIDEYSLEFPAGGLLKNEHPMDAAKREFTEETSLISDFIYLGDFRLMMNRTNIKEHIFFGINPKNSKKFIIEKGIIVELVNRNFLLNLSISGRYKQLAGLGIIQLASNYFGLNVMSDPMKLVLKKFKEKQNYES